MIKNIEQKIKLALIVSIGSFLTALAERYKGHPSLMAYDVWNECFYQPDICFHEATRLAFTEWLKEKYDSLDELRNERLQRFCWLR